MAKLLSVLLRISISMAWALSAAHATEMVYTPLNPSFGGNPNNGPNLMNVATAQNSNKAPTLSAVQNFNNSLQQAILNRLLSQSTNAIFGTGSTLTAGTYDTGNYTVVVTDQGSGNLSITTTDKNSGASATFNISASGVTP